MTLGLAVLPSRRAGAPSIKEDNQSNRSGSEALMVEVTREVVRADRDLQVLMDAYLTYAYQYNGAVDDQEVHDVMDVTGSANVGAQVSTQASAQVSTRVTAPASRPTSYKIGDVLEHQLGDQKGQRIRLLRYVDQACGKKRVNHDFFEYEQTTKMCCNGEQVIKFNPKKYKVISSIVGS